MRGALLFFVLLAQDPSPDDVGKLVADLGSDNPETRERATQELLKIGKPAAAELEKAARADDLEVRKRAERILKIIAYGGQLSPEIRRAIPGLVDLIVNDDWKEVFERLSRRNTKWIGSVKREDLVSLMRGAARSGIKGPLKVTMIELINTHGMRGFIPDLVEWLDDPDPGVRQKALYALNRFQARKAAPRIAERLGDPDPGVRKAAAVALGFIGTQDQWRQIAELLKDSEGSVRADAALSLGRLKVKDAVPALMEVVRQGGPIASYAVIALGEIGSIEVVPELRKLLFSRDSDLRSAAMWALDEVEVPDLVPDLVRLLADENAKVRQDAAYQLGKRVAQDAKPGLLKLLDDPEKDVRAAALRALVDLKAPEAWPILLGELEQDTPDHSPRLWSNIFDIADGLKKVGRSEEWRDLLPFLRNRDDAVRTEVGDVLGALKAEDAVPEIEKLLEDGDARVRRAAVHAVRSLGAKRSVPRLLKLLDDGEADVRREVLWTFEKLGATDVIPDLVRHLKGGGEADRKWTLYALGELKAKDAIPEVRECLGDPNAEVRSAAAAVAGDLGDVEAIPGLIKMIDDTDDDVRMAAIPALATLKARDAWPEIAKKLKDDEGNVRWRAARALGDLGVKESWPALADALSMEDSNLRSEALKALRRLKAAEAAPSILPLLDDQRDRDLALDVLARFGRREALDALLEEADTGAAHAAARAFLKLNLVRWIEFYEALESKEIPDPPKDLTVAALVKIVRDLGSIDVAGRPALEKIGLDTKAWLSERKPTVIDALYMISWKTRRAVVLDGGRVTLLPRDEALKFWREWAEKNK